MRPDISFAFYDSVRFIFGKLFEKLYSVLPTSRETLLIDKLCYFGMIVHLHGNLPCGCDEIRMA